MAQISEDEKHNNDEEWQSNQKFEWNLYNSSYWTITNKNRAKKNSDGSWRSVYGNSIIHVKDNKENKDSKEDEESSSSSQDRIKKIQWHVSITQTVSKNIMIGVCRDSWLTEGYGCYTSANGYMVYPYSPGYKYNGSSSSNYGKAMNGNGSVIIVTLNAHEKTLSFNIDNQDFGVAYSNLPNGQYRLAVDISSPNDEVTVTSEKIEYNNSFLMILQSLKEWTTDIKYANDAIKKQQQSISKNKDNNNENDKNNENEKNKDNKKKKIKKKRRIIIIITV
jgi:hypothetical protein